MRASMVIAEAGCGTGGKLPGMPKGPAGGLPGFARRFFNASRGNGRTECGGITRRSAAARLHAVYPGRA